MKVSTLGIVAAAAPLVVCSAAQGGFVGLTIEQLPMDAFPGLLTIRVYAQFDGTQGDSGNDFIFAGSNCDVWDMHISVRGGQYFQDPGNTHGGGDLSPDPSVCEPPSPDCADTYVTIGKDTSAGDATALAPGWPGFGPDSISFDDSGWFITPKFEQGLPDRNDRVLIMQLSTADGVGFLGENVMVAGFSNGFYFQECFDIDTGCHADVDGDNLVGIGDLMIVIAQWGPCPPTCLGDVTANGDVGIWDLLEVLAQWGSCE